MQTPARSPTEVARAISIASEFKLRLLLTDVRRVPRTPLEYQQLSVLLAADRLDELPELWDAYAALRAQRVPVGIMLGDAPLPVVLALSLPHARHHGISRTEMLAAFTAAPAGVLGARTVGRLVPGSSADFVVISGRLFENDARIERVFIGGREVYDRRRPRR
jgi:imidazolonepropionase-like amidohydrolase